MGRHSSMSDRPDRGYAWVVLAACSVMRLLNEGFWASLGILYVKWEVDFDVSPAKTSLIGSVYMLILFTIAPISSALAHRVTYRVVVIGSGIMAVICCFASTFITTFWHMYIVMALLSIGIGMSFPPSFSYFAYNFDKYTTVAYTLNSAASGVGMLAIPPILEILMTEFGWRGTFQIAAAAMGNLCVCGALLRPPTIEQQRNMEGKHQDHHHHKALEAEADSPKNQQSSCRIFLRDVARDFDLSLFKNIRFLVQTVVGGTLYGADCAAIIYFVPYSVSVGVSEMEASLLMLVFGVSVLFVRLSPVGWLIDKKILSASTVGGIAYLIFGLVIIGTPFCRTIPQLMAVAVVFGGSLGLGGSLQIVVVTSSAGAKEKAPAAVAWYFLMNGIGTTTFL